MTQTATHEEIALELALDGGRVIAVSYTHLDVYKRQPSAYVFS